MQRAVWSVPVICVPSQEVNAVKSQLKPHLSQMPCTKTRSAGNKVLQNHIVPISRRLGDSHTCDTLTLVSNKGAKTTTEAEGKNQIGYVMHPQQKVKWQNNICPHVLLI